MRRSRLRELSTGALALVALATLLVGVPVFLAATFGWPLPRAVPRWSSVWDRVTGGGLPPEVAVNAVVVVAWWCWTAFAASVLVEGIATARGTVAPRLVGLTSFQKPAARLIAAVILSVGLERSARDSVLPTRLIAAYAVEESRSAMPSRIPPTVATSARAEAAGAGRVYRVQPGDTPSGIALRELGDPTRWRELAPLNPHVALDPLRLHAGALLRLPPRTPTLLPTLVEEEAPTNWVRVRPDENLAVLALRHLGDESRNAEIADLNRGLPQPDRCCLEGNGDFIRPGWVLVMPGDAVGTSEGPLPPEIAALRGQAPPAPPTPMAVAASRPSPSIPPADPTPASSAPSASIVPAAASNDDHRNVVRLPSGAVVAASFASGVAAAMATGRLRRRRRWQPRSPEPGIIVTSSANGDGPLRRLEAAARADRDDDADGEAMTVPLVPRPVRADTPRPAEVEIGWRDGQSVHIDLLAHGALALGGEAAEEVLGAWIAALLAQAGPDDVAVVTDRATASTVLKTAPFPGLRIVSTPEDVLSVLEAEAATRTRLLGIYDDDEARGDFASYRAGDPDERLAAVVGVLGTVTDTIAARSVALCVSGPRLGFAIMGIGRWPAPLRVELSADAVVLEGPADFLGAELHRLPPEDAHAVMGVFATARTDGEGATSPAREPAQDFVAPLAPAHSRPPMQVTMFGQYRIDVNGTEVRTGLRRKARELLAYFLLRPDGATMERAIDALWPDADPDAGREHFSDMLTKLRGCVRDLTGDRDLKVIERIGDGRYRVQAAVIDVDLWRFEDGLREATTRRGSSDEAAALERAVDAYRGDLVEGSWYEWIEEATREDLHARALDAVARLADLREYAADIDGAITLLQQAVALDPVAEELCARLVRLQCDAGRVDAAKVAYRRLETELADIGADPEDTTGSPLARVSRRPPLD